METVRTTLLFSSNSEKCAISYLVKVPLPVNSTIVSLPSVVTVGDPEVVPEYFAVGILIIITPEPPAPPTP
tara:strand:- start:1434 stop:1646 length:213 start_codon:yes stop_codon:yes gene_type:complete